MMSLKMPALDPLQDIDLERLLTHIRLAGIAVGATELQRMQSVFSRTPVLSRPQLCELFCVLLGNNEQQRHTIRRLYEQLIPFEAFVKTDKKHSQTLVEQHADEIHVDQQTETTTESDDGQDKSGKPLNVLKFGIASLLVVGLLLLMVIAKSPSTETIESPEPIESTQTDTSTDQDPTATEQVTKYTPRLQKIIKLWIPTISVTTHPLSHYLMAPVLLLFGSGIGFFWLLHQAILRSRIRQPKKPVVGADCQFYLPPVQDSLDYFLLNGDQRREMTWGVTHVLTDRPLTRLDIPRSVRETARSGLPSVHFLPATQLQEIWLWQDQASENLDLSRLADEITNTLQHANLDVQRGYFHGFPDHVNDCQGSSVWSLQDPQPHNQPIVLILLDTDSLNAMDAMTLPHSHQLLQQFSNWNMLCVVDCSLQPGGLAPLLKSYGLTCLFPRQVSAWLAQQETIERSQHVMADFKLDDIQHWALACALPDRIVMIGEIRALHDAMQFNCAWHLNKLHQGYARPAGTGLDFSQQRRQSLRQFTELTQTQPQLARQAVQFWVRRYVEIDNRLLQQQTVQKPWKNSPQHYGLLLETALIQLWLPESLPQAAQQLYDLHAHQKLRKTVQQQLAQYALLDWPVDQSEDDCTHGHQQWIVLPYQANDLPSDSLQQLIASGMGGQADSSLQLCCDRHTSLLIGLLAGLSLIALIASALALRPHQPELINAGIEPRDKIQQLKADTLWLGTPIQLHKYPSIPTNSSVLIDWQSGLEQNNIIAIGASQLWRAGTLEYPQRPDNSQWPVLSVAVIAADPKHKATQQLAIQLLDTASVDQVLIGADWIKQVHHLAERGLDLYGSQWLYIFPDLQEPSMELPDWGQQVAVISGDWKPLLEILDHQGVHTLTSLQSDNTVIEIIRGIPVLNGVDNAETITLSDGIILQRIPKGSFQMGDKNSKYDDERPVHTVTFNQPFYMSQTEITFAQYDAYAVLSGVDKPDDQGWGRENQPVINVSWDDTQDYVKWLSQQTGYQCRLPSEAEWEYAARAGTKTNYFWGDAIANNQANCDGCGSQWDNKQTAPVASFAANPWGLYDMHGNVWEWVQDCWHEDYQSAPSDGSAWQKQCIDSRRRVLRGGSWDLYPDLARSALRFWFNPDSRDDDAGFRVVCSLPFTER